jgi:hypothetical protein
MDALAARKLDEALQLFGCEAVADLARDGDICGQATPSTKRDCGRQSSTGRAQQERGDEEDAC